MDYFLDTGEGHISEGFKFTLNDPLLCDAMISSSMISGCNVKLFPLPFYCYCMVGSVLFGR